MEYPVLIFQGIDSVIRALSSVRLLLSRQDAQLLTLDITTVFEDSFVYKCVTHLRGNICDVLAANIHFLPQRHPASVWHRLSSLGAVLGEARAGDSVPCESQCPWEAVALNYQGQVSAWRNLHRAWNVEMEEGEAAMEPPKCVCRCSWCCQQVALWL